MKAYDVYWPARYGLREQHIDTVFWVDNSTADEVRRSLVGHDGYAYDIIVRLVVKGRVVEEARE